MGPDSDLPLRVGITGCNCPRPPGPPAVLADRSQGNLALLAQVLTPWWEFSEEVLQTPLRLMVLASVPLRKGKPNHHFLCSWPAKFVCFVETRRSGIVEPKFEKTLAPKLPCHGDLWSRCDDHLRKPQGLSEVSARETLNCRRDLGVVHTRLGQRTLEETSHVDAVG
jgi:hypothetical protein